MWGLGTDLPTCNYGIYPKICQVSYLEASRNLGCLVVLGGLALSDSPAEARRKAILRALANGTIGGANPPESTDTSRLIEWLAQWAGINDPVRLNQEPLAGHLNVYTTIGGDSGFCTPGNAVYESAPPTLPDAIFIDIGMLKPLGVGGSDTIQQRNGISQIYRD